ncbi:MAG: hypothetical protein WD557_09420 [Dehalococcoidia bacterium]
MTQQIERQDGPERRPDELVVDQITDQLDRTVSLLRGSANEAAERALARLGGQQEVETRIAAELADRAPLAEPERFLEAHQLAMHALEVLDRDGFRDPPVPPWLGPLRPVAKFATEFVAEFIVKSYAQSIVERLRSLYARREVQCGRGTLQRTLLAGRRVEMDRLALIYKGGGLGAPALLGAGALIPVFASVTGYAGAVEWTGRPILITALVVMFLLLVASGWLLLNGAAVARRRSQLIMAAPLAALWQTVGRAGNPPEDDAVLYATIAVVLTTLVWIVIPAGLGLVFVVG